MIAQRYLKLNAETSVREKAGGGRQRRMTDPCQTPRLMLCFFVIFCRAVGDNGPLRSHSISRQRFQASSFSDARDLCPPSAPHAPRAEASRPLDNCPRVPVLDSSSCTRWSTYVDVRVRKPERADARVHGARISLMKCHSKPGQSLARTRTLAHPGLIIAFSGALCCPAWGDFWGVGVVVDSIFERICSMLAC